MKKRSTPPKHCREVLVYGSRDIVSPLQQGAYDTPTKMFPPHGSFTMSHGIPTGGSREELAHFISEFITLADIYGNSRTYNLHFIVEAFEEFRVCDIAPLFHEALCHPHITLPAKYINYFKKLSIDRGLPSAADINVYDTLDERSALETFLGLSVDDAIKMLRNNYEDCMRGFDNFAGHLGYMGPKAFSYYSPAWERLFGLPEKYMDDDLARYTVLIVKLRLICEKKLAEEEACAMLRLLQLAEQEYQSVLSEPDEQQERQNALEECSQLRGEISGKSHKKCLN